MYSPTPILIQYLIISSTETTRYYKTNRLEHALALTLEFIYMLGMKLTGDIAVVLDDNLQLLAIDLLLFLYCVTYSQFFWARLYEGRDLFSPWSSRLVKRNINHRC